LKDSLRRETTCRPQVISKLEKKTTEREVYYDPNEILISRDQWLESGVSYQG